MILMSGHSSRMKIEYPLMSPLALKVITASFTNILIGPKRYVTQYKSHFKTTPVQYWNVKSNLLKNLLFNKFNSHETETSIYLNKVKLVAQKSPLNVKNPGKKSVTKIFGLLKKERKLRKTRIFSFGQNEYLKS